jgi:hypothetical protein
LPHRAESGQPKGAVDRQYLSQQTGLHAQGAVAGADGRSPAHVPLLYSLLSARDEQRAGREVESAHVVVEGAARMPAKEDVALAAHYRQGGGETSDDEPIPGVSRVSSIGKSARGAQMPRDLGGGAPDPMVFSR